jgi:ribonuclease J
MSPVPTTVIRHPKERIAKCSLRFLHGRPEMTFLRGKPGMQFDATGFVLLAVDAPPLSRADAAHLSATSAAIAEAVGAARRCGYLQRIPPIVPAREFGYIPARRVLVVCTGSQGEPGAGLSRIAAADHPEVYADPDDTVVFSARAIPGNELPLERVVRLLQRQGARVITDADADVHVSGHPRRDELRALYGWVQPRHVMPVHGTPTKLEAHAELAESMDLGAVRARNGQRVRLCDGQIELLDLVRTGRLVRPAQGERPKPWDRQHEGRVRRR